MNEEILNKRLGYEFENQVYDVLDEAIEYTRKKHHYKKQDLVKLVMMIYKKDYSFISGVNGYRQQFELLDDYFCRQYGYSIIMFEMLKYILKFKNTEKYNDIMKKIAQLESCLRHGKKVDAEDLSIFSFPLSEKQYNNLMMKIENNTSYKYALAVVYDMVKNDCF